MGQAGDCDVIVSGSDDKTVRVWDAVTGQPAIPPLSSDPAAAVYAVAVGRAGDRDVIVWGDYNGTVWTWNSPIWRPASLPLSGHGWVYAVAVGRAGDRDVIVSGNEYGAVLVQDAVTGQLVSPTFRVGHNGLVYAVAAGRAGDRDVIVSGGHDKTVRVWDAVTGQLMGLQQFPDAIRSLALTGERLVVTQGNDVVVLRVNPAILPITGLSAVQEDMS